MTGYVDGAAVLAGLGVWALDGHDARGVLALTVAATAADPSKRPHEPPPGALVLPARFATRVLPGAVVGVAAGGAAPATQPLAAPDAGRGRRPAASIARKATAKAGSDAPSHG